MVWACLTVFDAISSTIDINPSPRECTIPRRDRLKETLMAETFWHKEITSTTRLRNKFYQKCNGYTTYANGFRARRETKRDQN